MSGSISQALVENSHSAPRAQCRFLVFEIDAQPFAIRLEDVVEIVPMATLSTQPGCSPVLLGFLNLQGAAVPVVNLARLARLPDVTIAMHTPLVIISRESNRFALLVSRVQQIVSTNSAAVLSMPAHTITDSAVTIMDKIIPIINIATLLLEKERKCIDNWRDMQQRRLDELCAAQTVS